jgi:hypothetical protein
MERVPAVMRPNELAPEVARSVRLDHLLYKENRVHGSSAELTRVHVPYRLQSSHERALTEAAF